MSWKQIIESFEDKEEEEEEGEIQFSFYRIVFEKRLFWKQTIEKIVKGERHFYTEKVMSVGEGNIVSEVTMLIDA